MREASRSKTQTEQGDREERGRSREEALSPRQGERQEANGAPNHTDSDEWGKRALYPHEGRIAAEIRRTRSQENTVRHRQENEESQTRTRPVPASVQNRLRSTRWLSIRSFKLIGELPRGPLSDIELRRAARELRVPHFRGVFLRDSFARKRPRVRESAIVNLDTSAGPGTHWVAYFKSGDRVLYYDSFGDLPPPVELVRYFAGSSIEYNYTPEQTFGTSNCGHLCLKFLIKATAATRSSR